MKDVNPVGYKSTDVGVIPEDWDIKTIENIAPLQRGFDLPNSQLQKGKYPVVYSNGVLNYHIEYKAKAPGVVTGRSGTIGKVTYIKEDYFPHNTTLWVTDFKSNYPLFIYYLYKNIHLERFGSGSGVPTLNRNDVHSFKTPLPPLPEQKAIARVLSDVDDLIRECDSLLAKKRDIKQGTMQQLLTGKKRLPGFSGEKGYKQTEIGEIPEDWITKPLKTVSSMSGRIGWQGLKQEEFTTNNSDPFLITGMNFKDGKIRWNEVYHIPEKRYQEAKNIQLQEDDILMTKDGTIGKLLYVDKIPFPGKASLNSHLLVFRPLNNAYAPKFLFYQLSSKQFLNYIDLNKSGSTFFGITQEAVGNYNAYLPTLPEQKAIAKILSDMDAEIEALEKKRDKYKAIKQGMMQELLTGKTRLIEN